jgi:hypothetical protein
MVGKFIAFVTLVFVLVSNFCEERGFKSAVVDQAGPLKIEW